MLAADESKVRSGFRDVVPSLLPSAAGGAAVVKGISRFFALLGLKRTAGDLTHLSNTLAWVSDKAMLPYMGAPSKAIKEAGEAMLKTHVLIAMELFDRALAGNKAEIRPLLWSLKFLRLLPEA